jgi:hypothetical protein
MTSVGADKCPSLCAPRFQLTLPQKRGHTKSDELGGWRALAILPASFRSEDEELSNRLFHDDTMVLGQTTTGA